METKHAPNPTAVELTNISADVLEWTEEDMNEAMAGMGVKPEDLSEPAERMSYEQYLSKQNEAMMPLRSRISGKVVRETSE